MTMPPRFIAERVHALPLFAGVPTADELARAGRLASTALLHLNESPYPPSPAVIEAVARAAAGANRYGESSPKALAAKVGHKLGVAPDLIVFGNGSDEVLALVCTLCLGPGDSAVAPTPSFPRYRIGAAIMGARTVLVRNRPDGRNDVDGLLRAVDGATKVVFACTPNNPSGAALAPAEIAALARGVPDDVLLVVDEAYYEFDAYEGGAGALGALQRRRGPWLSTRTLSKAYALAGMRIGYGVASDRTVADGLAKVKLNFNLSRLAIAAADAALDEEAYARATMGRVIAERHRVAARLAGLGLAVLPSRTNFVSFDYGSNAVPVMDALRAEGVLVREWRDPGFETFIRMTIGSAEENDRALLAIAATRAGPGTAGR